MQILSNSSETVIARLTIDEIANIAGSPSEYRNITIDRKGEIREVEVRDVMVDDLISVSDVYNKARNIVNEYDGVKKQLSSVKSACTNLQNKMKA